MGANTSRGAYDLSAATSSQGKDDSDVTESTVTVKKIGENTEKTTDKVESGGDEEGKSTDDSNEQTNLQDSPSQGENISETTAGTSPPGEPVEESEQDGAEPERSLEEQGSEDMATSNGSPRKPGPPCLVAIRFGLSYLQTFKNSTVKNRSVLKNYGGTYVGCAEQIKVAEGDWPNDRLLALYTFPSVFRAEQWITSDPDVKQQDWLSGVDIALFSLTKSLHPEKNVFLLVHLVVDEANMKRFNDEYMAGVLPQLEAADCTQGLVSDHAVNVPRGLWTPELTLLDQFRSVEDIIKWSTSEEYQPLKKFRHEIAQTTALIFQVNPKI